MVTAPIVAPRAISGSVKPDAIAVPASPPLCAIAAAKSVARCIKLFHSRVTTSPTVLILFRVTSNTLTRPEPSPFSDLKKVSV